MRFILLVLLFIVYLPIHGQLIYDRWGDIVPYSECEKYAERINSDKIHTLILPSYNSDSLFHAHNKNISRNASAFAAGFSIDTLINIKKKGKKFRLDEGTLWIYTIESPTAWGFSVELDHTIIPEGAYLGFLTEKYFNDDPEYILNEDFDDGYFSNGEDLGGYVRSHRMTIEYFEPKHLKMKIPIVINEIVFYYAGTWDPQIFKKQYEEEHPERSD